MTATTRPAVRPDGLRPRPQRAPLRVVEPGEPSVRARRRRTRWLAAATGAFVCCGLFGVVAFHRLDSQVAAQQSQYDRLRLQIATLESPARIVAAAQERLGMVPPPSVRYLSPSAGAPPSPAKTAVTHPPAVASSTTTPRQGTSSPPTTAAPRATSSPSTTAPPRPKPTTAPPTTAPRHP